MLPLATGATEEILARRLDPVRARVPHVRNPCEYPLRCDPHDFRVNSLAFDPAKDAHRRAIDLGSRIAVVAGPGQVKLNRVPRLKAELFGEVRASITLPSPSLTQIPLSSTTIE